MRRLLGRVAGMMMMPALLLGACATTAEPVGGVVPTISRYADIEGWSSDHVSEVLPAMRRDCARLGTIPADQPLGGGALAAAAAGRAGQWAQPCAALQRVPDGDDAAAHHYLEAWFEPHSLADPPGTPALFTGYFEPQVAGSRVRGGLYQVPLLARPDDLIRLPPPTPNGRPIIARRLPDGRTTRYYSRAEIEAGALDNQDLALVWLTSPVDLFFLQIQGSGRIVTPTGEVIRVVFDGQNGLPYVPIGRRLIDQHEIAAGDVSLQSIKAWLSAHPDRIGATLDQNPDYVFFRIASGVSPLAGPPGALGIALTPSRSVAVDRVAIPLATPVFIATADPLTRSPWRHLTIAQDLGTDINGAVRADIFFGSGMAAESAAGHMHETGSAWILLPRQSAG